MIDTLAYWGKARPACPEGPAFHPLAYHSLDVAACLQRILDVSSGLRAAIGRQFESADWRPALVFLAALHDIGKFARKFQGKRPELYPKELGLPLPSGPYNHALGGYAMLVSTELGPLLDPLLESWGDDDREAILRAVAYHHGRPLDTTGSGLLVGIRLERSAFGNAAPPARAFVTELSRLLDPAPLPPPRDGAGLAWSLSGLVNLADWLGSNEEWFRYCPPMLSLADYWATVALPGAERAVRAAGLARAPISTLTGLRALTGRTEPSPAQRWAETVEAPQAPMLFVLEDLTGSGKTEAALVLAHRLMAAGRAEGVYVALPTMATANAMYVRLAASYRRMFAMGAKPSLALAHGRSKLHGDFTASIIDAGDERELRTLESDDETSSAACAAWIADDRRRALFAHVGVGTIDQALLAVLPSKHATLRQLALARKVLIVDEAHAYDAYMSEELQRLLEFHAKLGGSAIVLSATLPSGVKRKLVRAYTAADWTPKQGYPLVTTAAFDGAVEDRAIEPRKGLPRRLVVERLAGMDEALERIIAAARQGAAVAYVRNTVDDAIAAWEKLRARGVEATLFHARFAMGDRQKIEEGVLGDFGPKGKNRAGRVVIASQVIEQSVDADFDLMVSDLAPIDLLIQRAGRVWRHERGVRPLPDARLLVVSPDPDAVSSAKWFTDAFPLASAVYRNHAVLWLSAKHLFKAGCILSPERVRPLVEAVYPEKIDVAPETVPEVLRSSWDQARSKNNASRSFANMNLLKFTPAYDAQNAYWDADFRIPTREGEEMTLLRLARLEGNVLRPWCEADDGDAWRAWALSEVSVRAVKVKGLAPAPDIAAQVRTLEAEWEKHRIRASCVVFTQAEDGVWRGMLSDASPQMTYTPDRGIGIFVSSLPRRDEPLVWG